MILVLSSRGAQHRRGLRPRRCWSRGVVSRFWRAQSGPGRPWRPGCSSGLADCGCRRPSMGGMDRRHCRIDRSRFLLRSRHCAAPGFDRPDRPGGGHIGLRAGGARLLRIHLGRMAAQPSPAVRRIWFRGGRRSRRRDPCHRLLLGHCRHHRMVLFLNRSRSA